MLNMFSVKAELSCHIFETISRYSLRACTLMCLRSWSLLGLVKDNDIFAVTVQAEVEGEEEELPDGWDAIADVPKS